jgi:hypothetical protein
MTFKSDWKTSVDFRQPEHIRSLYQERKSKDKPPIEQATIPPRIKHIEVNEEPQAPKRFPWMRPQVP